MSPCLCGAYKLLFLTFLTFQLVEYYGIWWLKVRLLTYSYTQPDRLHNSTFKFQIWTKLFIFVTGFMETDPSRTLEVTR